MVRAELLTMLRKNPVSWQSLNFILVPRCSSLQNSMGDKGSNTHSRGVPARLSAPRSPPTGACQAAQLEPRSVHAAWGCCELQPLPGTVHGAGQPETASRAAKCWTRYATCQEGQGAHPDRHRYASLNSVLAEKLQLQHFSQLGTPGDGKGWSLPGGEVQKTLTELQAPVS